LQRYKQAADKGWSLTDCASFQVMEAEHVQAALTHDQHFAEAGFETLLR
jgi:predicted nucleic acid-binding protein